jgi:6-hydroxycyclohex-1-ene-1-carbonyl-CoA dehydrogenase
MGPMLNGGWEAWVMAAPGSPLERRELPPQVPSVGEVVIEVAGCGVCHTDLSFLYSGVKTRSAPPLVLGHEISGIVRQMGPGADPGLLDRAVVVPAVLPCGECELCRAGRRTICRRQVMPGNDRDGGFASHVVVPARFVCAVPAEALARHELWELAVVSDALSTPFEAVRRSELATGEVAIVVGAGGIGIHAVQVASAVGAIVLALDVDDSKLVQAREAGAAAGFNVLGIAVKEVRKLVKAEVERLGGPPHLWKIFETSGTAAGQELAYALIGFGAALAVVGFTTEKVTLGLSNLMAYDAVARGNWGADPLVYPELLEWIGAGRIQVKPFVERHPLSRINEVFAEAHHHRLLKRAVLVP